MSDEMITVEAEGHNLSLALDQLVLLVNNSTVSVDEIKSVDCNVASQFIHIQIFLIDYF